MSKRKSDRSSLLENNKRRATHQPNFELFCQPSAACQTLLPTFTDDLNEARYEKVISDANQGFDDLLSNLLCVLDIRALAHGQALQIDKGLQDAHLMISLAPLKASGYLRAAALYSQRSQQAEAINIYEQGLKVVPQEERTILEERYTFAKALRDRNVDFIKALPFDLATTIIFSLPREALYQALDVSTTWRHHVLQYPRLWEQITLTQQKEIGYLSIVGQHIQTLQLSGLNHSQCEQVFAAIMNGMCKKLDFLHLASSRINDYGRCLMALSQVKNTLTKLEIVLPKESPIFPLAVVLSACSNLKRVYYAHYTAAATTESFGTISSASMCPSLLDLELSFGSISTAALRKILPCCPNVRKLSIDFCDITAIGAVRDCCPALVAFGYNRCVPIDEQQKKTAFSTVSTGIRHIASSALEGPDYGELLRLISDNANTLETLAFRFPRSDAPEEVRRQLTDVTAFNNLRQLETNFKERSNPMVGELILRCPFLECLSIYYADYIDAAVFQAISRLSHLQQLHISCIGGMQEEAMVSMLQTFATYSSLRTLQLAEFMFDVTDGILQSIANIPSLNVLELSEIRANRTAFEAFVKALENSSVHSIILGFLDCVSDKAIRYINSMQSLKRLELYNLENVTHDGLLCVFNNSKISLLVETLK